ncbi:MAG: hypothetical protein KC466_07315, partial [Myxococcales bacterium]|nr:hypothetical protein [Myxococcales bacterium]
DYETPQAFGKINVYYLEFANADELATTLASLAGGAGGASRTSAATGRPGAVPGAAQAAAAPRGGATAALEFEGDVRITSDPATNSLIIVASPQDFLTLRDVIRKLDIRRRQVYVEAVILEASPTSLDQIGFELRGAQGKGREKFINAGPDNVVGTADDVFEFDLSRVLVGGTGTIPNSLGGSGSFLDGIVNSLANPTTATNPLSSIGGGLTLGAILETINVPDPNNPGQFLQLPASSFLLRALRNDTETNIVSTPHLLTTDNEEAEIIVGQNVPFISGTNQNNNNFTTNVTREDVGITLRFTPQINESDFVRLNLFVEVSSLVASAVGQDVNEVGPTTSTRTAQSTIIVKDQETIVIGGLIQDQETIQESKIPYLGDIPILGWLFKYRSSELRKTNLLLFLTPTIIKDERDSRQVFWEQERAAEKVMNRLPHEIVQDWMRPKDADTVWKGRPWKAPGVDPNSRPLEDDEPGPEGAAPHYIDIPAPAGLN